MHHFYDQSRLRDMQDSWLSKKAEDIQSFADRKDMKKFYDTLKSSGTTLMTYKDAVFKRWTGHIVCAESSINDNTNTLPLVECNVLLDEFQTVTETTNTIRLLSSDKVPGSDKIPEEIYKAGGQPMTEKPT